MTGLLSIAVLFMQRQLVSIEKFPNVSARAMRSRRSLTSLRTSFALFYTKSTERAYDTINYYDGEG